MSRDRAIVIGLVVSAILVGIGRFTIPSHGLSWPGTYEALVHIWCGVLIVFSFQRNWLALGLLITLTTLEVVIFMLR